MEDLSHLAKGVNDALVGKQFGLQEGAADKDPDGGTTFENMDGDAGYAHKASSDTLGHDHYKKH